MRYKKKLSKKEIKKAHEFGAAGFFKGDGKGKQLKGLAPQPPTVRIASGLLDKLVSDGRVTLGYQYTEENRKRWIDNRPTEVQVGSVDFYDDRIIECNLVNNPEVKKGIITVDLSKTHKQLMEDVKNIEINKELK